MAELVEAAVVVGGGEQDDLQAEAAIQEIKQVVNSLFEGSVTCDEAIRVVDRLRHSCEEDAVLQIALGQNGKLANLLVSYYSSQTHFFGKLETSQLAQLMTSFQWLLCRLCRRKLDKSTACVPNIEAIAPLIPQVVNAIRSFKESAAFAYAGCWFVMVMASDSDERQDLLIQSNVAPVVVGILVDHVGNPINAEFALRAVRNLSISEENAIALTTEGVCPAIERALQYYLQLPSLDMRVLEAIMWATVNLSCEDQIATQLGQAGCIRPLLTFIDRLRKLIASTDDEEDYMTVMCAGLSALRNLSGMNAFNYSAISETDICVIVSDCITSFAHQSKIMEILLWIVANIGCDTELANRMLVIGLQSTIKSAVHTQYNLCFPNSSGSESIESAVRFGPVAESLLWSIRNLSAAGLDMQTNLATFVDDIFAYMTLYRMREGMVQLSVTALMGLCNRKHLENIRTITSPDRVGLILDCMREHIRCVELMECGLKLFSSVMRFDVETKQRLGSTAAGSIYAFALEVVFLHVGEPDIFRYTCDIVRLTKYDNSESIEFLMTDGLLEEGDDSCALPPSGKFHTLVGKWKLDSLAQELGINVHSEDWDPALIMTVSRDMLTEMNIDMSAFANSGADE